MLGRYLFQYLEKRFEVDGTTRNEIDFADTQNLQSKMSTLLKVSAMDLVINCVGTIKPRCDELGPLNAIAVNSLVPHILLKDSKEKGYKLLHPTTDCVFSGKTGNYNENSEMDVNDLYGISKYLGENKEATNLRVSIIGEETINKRSLVEWCKGLNGSKANGFSDHLWNGITCLTYAKIVETMITNNIWWTGTRHVLSPKTYSKYELVKEIIQTFKISTDLREQDSGKPCNRTLSTLFSENSQFKIPDLSQQIYEMKNFSQDLHKNI